MSLFIKRKIKQGTQRDLLNKQVKGKKDIKENTEEIGPYFLSRQISKSELICLSKIQLKKIQILKKYMFLQNDYLD